MKELLRTNDPVLVSFVEALMRDAGIGYMVADQNMSIVEGSLGILPRRILVENDGADRARRILVEAGIEHELKTDLTAGGTVMGRSVRADEADMSEPTVDAFHRGAFHLVQPAGSGHRAGMDAMMLAAAVPDGFGGLVADLGAGAGAAALAVLARCPGANAVLVERSPEMAGLARRTLGLEANAAYRERARVLEADVTLAGKARVAAGLGDRAFDFAIMNPPFNSASDRATPDALKADAHVMADGLFESWLRTAAAIVRPGGHVALIARPVSLPAILAALGRRFGDAGIVPLHPRPQSAAIRIVVRARRGARGGLSLCPPVFLHEREGRDFTASADAVINGQAGLFFAS